MAKNIYPKLRIAMAYKEDTLSDLSKLLGIHTSTIRLKLKGLSKFNLSELKVLSDHYEIPIDELVSES